MIPDLKYGQKDLYKYVLIQKELYLATIPQEIFELQHPAEIHSLKQQQSYINQHEEAKK